MNKIRNGEVSVRHPGDTLKEEQSAKKFRKRKVIKSSLFSCAQFSRLIHYHDCRLESQFIKYTEL